MTSLVGLSVSSVGSWALQLCACAASSCHRQAAFSILGRIVGTATLMHPVVALWRTSTFSILGRIVGTATAASTHLQCNVTPYLSVSSVGSWALQHAMIRCPLAASQPFSILGRIVGTATKLRRSLTVWHGCTFSILGRIVGTATTPAAVQPISCRRFQYPRSDRGHCNSASDGQRCDVRDSFQYPRSDRGHCNYAC